MELQKTERLRRFIRNRHHKPTLVLQPRDVDIVTVVAEHRVITSDDIQLLVPGSPQTLVRRLQRLYHHGYLDRPRSQRQRGNAAMAYALGQKGAQLLATHTGGASRIDWSEKNRQLGAHYLEHALMVSRFQAALRSALSASGLATLDRWLGDGEVRDAVMVDTDTARERIPIAPDALFTLRLRNEPEGRNRVHLILEADRGTMTTKRFLTKLRGYWHWWRSGRQERLGVRNFRVLTVTRSKERADSLREVAHIIDAPRHRGLGLFLFGPERAYANGSAHRVLDAIWQSPADDILHGLLE